MKKIIICLSIIAVLLVPDTILAEKIMMPITGWEQSFWQYGDATGLAENGTGVEATNDENWVQSGNGALHVWCEASKANLNAQAVQQVTQFMAGKEYRLTGKLYISSSSWGFGLYIGDTRLTMLRAIVEYGKWCDLDYTFTYNTTSKDFKLQVAQAGHLYADDLSLREVIRDTDGGITGYGEELLVNGGFEDDFIPPADVTGVRAEVYSQTVELSWKNPDDDKLDKIIIMQGGEIVSEVDASQTCAIIDGLENGIEYTFVIKTKSRTGVMSEGVSIKAMPVRQLPLPVVIKDDVLDRIIGLDENMEYSSDGGVSWIRYDGTEPELSGNTTVLVRLYTDDAGAVTPALELNFTETASDDGEIMLKKAEIRENRLAVEGVLNQQAKAAVTVLLIMKDADRRDFSKILAVGQTQSNDEGEFSFAADIADSRFSQFNDGEYVLYVDSTVTDEVSKDGLIFINSQKCAEAMEKLWTEASPYYLLEPDSEYYNAYVCIGLPVEEYNGNTNIKSSVISDFVTLREKADKTQGYAALTEALVTALVMNVLEMSDADTVYQTLVKYNGILDLNYGTVSFETLMRDNQQAVSWVCDYMAGKTYAKAEDLNADFAAGYALYLINQATYGNIADIIAVHKQTLGINSSTYDKYAALSSASDQKIYVNKKLVLEKTSAPFKSTDALVKAIEKAMADYKPTDTGGGGGGGSGSSSSSGTYSVTPTVTSGTSNTSGGVFSDLDDVKWAEEGINYLYKNGIISGTGENRFEPQREITREEFVAVLVRAFGIYNDTTPAGFSDVSEDAWYYAAVTSAANAGIVSGIGAEEFGVGKSITRQDIAVMLYRCLEPEEKFGEGDFIDIDEVDAYAKEAVSAMQALGYISGYTDGSFRPAKTATRAEASQILYSILTDERNAK